MKLERILIEFGYKITKYDICGASGVCEENGVCEASGVCGESGVCGVSGVCGENGVCGASGVYWKSVWDAVDSANVAIKNNRRVNRVILFFDENNARDSALDSANDALDSADSALDSANKKSAESTKSILRNLLQNGVEIVVFLKNCTEAQSAFWRTFGIVYLLK